MRKTVLSLAINVFGIYLVDYLLQGVVVEGGWKTLVLAGIIVGLANFLVKPILKVLSLPFIFLSAGLFLIVINAVILFLTQFAISVLNMEGISLEIKGVVAYLLAALILGIFNLLAHRLLLKK